MYLTCVLKSTFGFTKKQVKMCKKRRIFIAFLQSIVVRRVYYENAFVQNWQTETLQIRTRFMLNRKLFIHVSSLFIG